MSIFINHEIIGRGFPFVGMCSGGMRIDVSILKVSDALHEVVIAVIGQI